MAQEQPEEGLVLQLHDVAVQALPGDVYDVTLFTSRGEISCLLHPAEGELGAVVWLGGPNGDLNGPAGGIFTDLGHELRANGISSLRLRYRLAGSYQECVLDALAGLSFLKGLGARRFALVGHSTGAAVAISAAAINREVQGVAGLSSQLGSAELVEELRGRPLLLIHGAQDLSIAVTCSEELYKRAHEPKRLLIYPTASHMLLEVREEVGLVVKEWLIKQVGHAAPAEGESPTLVARLKGGLVRPILTESREGLAVKELVLYQGDLTELDVDALVCPTNDELWMSEGVGAAILAKGGEAIQFEALDQGPVEIGDAIVTRGGLLRAGYIIHAVTGGVSAGYHLPDSGSVQAATASALARAEELGLRSIGFPALGAGVGGFPLEKAARVMVQTITDHLRATTSLQKVIIALLGVGAYRAFEAELKQYM